jgi:hypothetical protein
MGHPVNAAAVGSLAAYMDLGNIHPYPGGSVPLANLVDHEQRVATIDGGRPMLVTETGYHTAVAATSGQPAVSEDAMGRYVPRLFLDNFAAGISRSYLYELIDEGTSLANQEQNFGLLRNDGTPKPAFTALANLIAVLADPGPAVQAATMSVSISGDTAGVARLALLKRDGRQYLILWQDVPSYDLGTRTAITVQPKNVVFRFASATGVRVFDPAQSASAISTQRVTTLGVAVADRAIVVEITR